MLQSRQFWKVTRSQIKEFDMRLAILTGGGDVPGLNPCIRSITMSAAQRGGEVIGLRRGWEGVLEMDPSDSLSLESGKMGLDKDRVRGIDRLGGTILHSSRRGPCTTESGEQWRRALVIRGPVEARVP